MRIKNRYFKIILLGITIFFVLGALIGRASVDVITGSTKKTSKSQEQFFIKELNI